MTGRAAILGKGGERRPHTGNAYGRSAERTALLRTEIATPTHRGITSSPLSGMGETTMPNLQLPFGGGIHFITEFLAKCRSVFSPAHEEVDVEVEEYEVEVEAEGTRHPPPTTPPPKPVV